MLFTWFREFSAITLSILFFSVPFSHSCFLGYHLPICKNALYYPTYHRVYFLNLFSLFFQIEKFLIIIPQVPQPCPLPSPFWLLSPSREFFITHAVLFQVWTFHLCFVFVFSFPFFAQIPPFVHSFWLYFLFRHLDIFVIVALRSLPANSNI